MAKICRATNTRFFPDCRCGAGNTESHAANYCKLTMTDVLRESRKSRLDSLHRKMNYRERGSLHEYIIHGFFSLVSRKSAEVSRVIKLIRNIVFDCVTKLSDKADKENVANF